jgi:phosphopantothenoylcysteine synthetase/decarboxylase
VLYLVVCAAPPARRIGELIDLLQQGGGWSVYVIPTPTAMTWVDAPRLAAQTGHPVRAESRGPDEPTWLPPADTIAVVPATFNTINKWAAGINDTLALGVLNEAFGLGLPVLVSPYAKPALTAHPAFSRSLATLKAAGADLTETEAIRPASDNQSFGWQVITDALQ